MNAYQYSLSHDLFERGGTVGYKREPMEAPKDEKDVPRP